MLLQDSLVNQSDNSRTKWRVLAFCFLLVVVCYGSSIANAFILDDILIVAANEQIRTIAPLHFLSQSYWGDLTHEGIYRPLTIFSFSLVNLMLADVPSACFTILLSASNAM